MTGNEERLKVIRILIADDCAAVRSGLSEYLANYPDVNLVGAAPDSATAVSLAAASHPDVVIMDLMMPGIGGIEATRQIVAAQPGTRVIMHSALSGRSQLAAAMAAGATGFVSKGEHPQLLLQQVRQTGSAE